MDVQVFEALEVEGCVRLVVHGLLLELLSAHLSWQVAVLSVVDVLHPATLRWGV